MSYFQIVIVFITLYSKLNMPITNQLNTFFVLHSFQISRQSIDACKDYFRDDLLKADWALMVELKKQFQIL